MMANVSVIIPTYNRAQLLNNSVNSVLSQTHCDFELLIIDDCSTDNTSEVLEGIKDERVRVIKNPSNRGIAAVRNIGIMNSRGRYIAFLDDDDEWLPDKLEKQLNMIENSPAGLGCVYTGCMIIDMETNDVYQTSIPQYRNNVLTQLLMKNFITTSTTMIKKTCFDKAGLFDEEIPYGEDYDMWIRIAGDFEFDYIKEPLVKYRIHKNSISTNNAVLIKGLEMILAKHEVLFSSDKRAYSNFLLMLGVAYCYIGKTKEGIKVFVKAIKLYQFDARLYYNLALAVLGAETFIKLKEAKRHYFPLRIKAG